jgi:putative ABC transport system permease protein
MGSFFDQCAAVIGLNLRSIPLRFSMSLATIVAVAMAASVLLGFRALSNGFDAVMRGSGSPSAAVVLRDGSDSELGSIVSVEQLRIIAGAPGVAQRNGAPLVSGELFLTVDGVKRSTGKAGNLPLRGVGPEALAIRRDIRIAEGRMFRPGTNELVVGRGLLREYSGFEMGRTVRFGASTWKVVGVFEAPGTVFESELWADTLMVQRLFDRGTAYQSVRVALTDPDAFADFERFVENDPRLQLVAKTERDYYADQAAQGVAIARNIGLPLAITMAIGALFGALNTMYSSVSARAAEIATLRIIGFSGFAAFFGTLAESLVLAVVGALAGAVFCYAVFNGMTTSTIGQSFTQIVFQLKMSPELVLQAIVMALMIGLAGGILPGIRAARQRPLLELAGQ